MTYRELNDWMDNPALLTKSSLQELRQIMDEYPYFHAVRMLYLKNLAVLQDVRLDKELKKMSIYVPDRRQLYNLIHELPPIQSATIEQEPGTARTNQTEVAIEVIEKALPDTAPDEQDFVATLAPKQVSPLIATSDYVNWLAQNTEDLPAGEGSDNRLKRQELIDSFIAGDSNQLAQRLSHSIAKNAPEPAVERENSNYEVMDNQSLDDSYFTETLARVYITQKRYDKALEIIKVLSLKYPKKNRYFADQIRYLEKIINLKK